MADPNTHIATSDQFILPRDPLEANEAATKNYVDDTIANLSVAAGTPTGGTTGQILAKASNTDHDTTWVTPTAGGAGELPTGGNEGQVLAKNSSTDKDVTWVDSAIPDGGDEGQVLGKISDTDKDVDWVNHKQLEEISQNDYDSLSQEEKDDPNKVYLITDAIIGYLKEDQGISNANKILITDSTGKIKTSSTYPSAEIELLPDGGIIDQVLAKASNLDRDVTWVDANYVPPGGTDGQLLAKASDNDHDLTWTDPPDTSSGGGTASFPPGGTTGQVLGKASNADDDVAWLTIAAGGGGGISPATDPPDTSKEYVLQAIYSGSAWVYSWVEVIK